MGEFAQVESFLNLW